MNKELLIDRNYIKKLRRMKQIINKNQQEIELVNFKLIYRKRNKTLMGLVPVAISLEETMNIINESNVLEIDNLLKIIINKCFSIIDFSCDVITTVGYNISLWNNTRTILEYILFFNLLTNKEWDEQKLRDLAYRTSIHKWNITKNPNGLFGIFKDKIKITNELEELERDMPTFYATLSSHSHPSLRLNDLSKDQTYNSVVYFQNLYTLALLLDKVLEPLKY